MLQVVHADEQARGQGRTAYPFSVEWAEFLFKDLPVDDASQGIQRMLAVE